MKKFFRFIRFVSRKSHKRFIARTGIALVAVLFLLVATVPDVHATHRAAGVPKIVNWYYKWSVDSDTEAEELAEWDVLIIDLEDEYYSRSRLEYIKQLNPDIKLLAYISMSDIRPDAVELDQGTSRRYVGEELADHPEWALHLANGDNAEWWPTYTIFNVTSSYTKNGQRYNEFLPKFVRDAVIKDSLWDGVFYDNVWEGLSFVSDSIDVNNDGSAETATEANKKWRKGVKKILKKTRKYAKKNRKNFIVSGNGGVRYYRHINGVGFEHFPNTLYGGWTDSLVKYFFVMRHAARDPFAFINSNVNNVGDQTDYKKFRYGLASTLLNDGYYSFDLGDRTHHERWYYDEYNVLLGDPVTGAYNVLSPNNPTQIVEGVWRRDFENATVLVNSTSASRTIDLQNGYEKINGVQDSVTNSGDVIGLITIPAEDGIILLNRLSVVRDSTFVNGAFSKVFDGTGKEERQSFFAYDGSFPGSVQVYKVSGNNKTVVAGDTTVTVYNSRNEAIASFAPYGASFAGGINIAVGKLYGTNKNYIVTGPQSNGAHVRIFDLNGNLINPGCFPYDDAFEKGVNVAMGDINGDGIKEIVVGARAGGPHVRVLNKYCELINPGFFAYSGINTGVHIAVGDINGDGTDEIITAPETGGAPQIRIFDKNGTLLAPAFYAYSASDRSGVFVSTADIDADGTDEIITNSFAIFNGL